MTRTVKHPHLNITLTFDPEPHTYRDSEGAEYVSATTLIKSAFPEFDAPTVAAKCAEKQGKPAETLIAEWDAKRNAAADFGTRLHANAEATIRGQPRPNAPRTPREVKAFKVAAETAAMLCKRFGAGIEAEKIIFSPFFEVAGTVDVLGHTDAQTWTLLDWKSNEVLKRENGFQSCIVPGLEHLQDCDLIRYSLQLSLYEMILRRENYVPQGATVRRFIVWIGPDMDKPEFIETADMRGEVAAIMLERECMRRVVET